MRDRGCSLHATWFRCPDEKEPQIRVIGAKEAIGWCAARALSVKDADAPRLAFASEDHLCAEIQLPKDAPRLVSVAQVMLTTFVQDDDERKFEGCLLWLTRWDIWSEKIERAGWLLLEQARIAASVPSDSRLAPATLFDSDEVVAAQSTLALPLLFQWDAYLVPASGRHFFVVSHEGLLYVVVRSKLELKQILTRFKKWKPVARCPRYLDLPT